MSGLCRILAAAGAVYIYRAELRIIGRGILAGAKLLVEKYDLAKKEKATGWGTEVEPDERERRSDGGFGTDEERERWDREWEEGEEEGRVWWEGEQKKMWEEDAEARHRGDDQEDCDFCEAEPEPENVVLNTW